MRLKVTSIFTVFVCGVMFFHAPACLGQASAVQQAEWREKIDKAKVQLRGENRDAAVRLFEEAFAMGPTEDHKADALIEMARAYENAFMRSEAIATYKRIITECPDTREMPLVCARLGEVHRSISLVHPEASEAEQKAVMEEMRNAVAARYFEMAVRSGAWFNREVLRAKWYLVGIYPDMGREEDAVKILDEFLSMDFYDVKEPDYVGPYYVLDKARGTYAERVDEARRRVESCRRGAMASIVRGCIWPGDPLGSIEKLQAVIEKYAGTEIEKMAREKLEEVSQQMAKQLPYGVTVDPGDDPLAEEP